MDSCEFVNIDDCPATINGYDAYWSAELNKCVCRMQPLNPRHQTFNIELCRFQCVPEVCKNDSYYWDSIECACRCYPKECKENFVWSYEMCSCECISPQPVCECGYEWDPHCCACELCFDKGLCNPRTEFYNPVTCQCDCMPTCCDEGEKWYQLTCSCGPFVCDPLADGYFICDDQTDPDCELYPTSARLLCYEMMNIFVDLVTDINTCTCSKQTNPNPPAECINPLNPAYYTVECCEDPRSPLFGSVECGAFEYAIHFTGCQLYLEYQTFDAVWTNW